MSGGLYGGDEVGAIVFDAGSHSFRAGYGGEEYPKFDIPAYVGVREAEMESKTDATIEEVASGRKGIKKNDYFIGTTKVNVPRSNTEIISYMKDGLIEDWDAFEKVLDYLYKDCLLADSQHHSVLFTEAPWNTKDRREKLTELLFEKYNVPAFYLVKNAVLAAFANGRVAGLILDSGATHTSAIPVYDGYCLTHAVVRSPIGGDFIVDQCKKVLDKQNIDIVPYYQVGSKKEVKDGEPSVWKERTGLPPVTRSYADFMKKQVIEDFAHSTLQLCDTPIDVEFIDKLPASSYGFPCGFRKDFLSERARIPEALFDLKHIEDDTNNLKDTLINVSTIAATSCGMCDVDLRPTFYSNLMITGGNSLIMGFTERLNHDLAHKCPATMKLRVSAAPTPVERRYGAWIGGSIVSSLGTFQQLWISKGEFDESGKAIVERKCP
ncbi:actin domain-containing protein [Ditylenchus destructor]|nr:actin domain-containing protein [Ditylenchus destructor]